MKPAYAVFRFSLKAVPNGSVTQEVTRCGEFDDVEQAFDTARQEALREWEATLNDLRRQEQVGRVVDIKLKDTEWGYELKREHQVVSRFWVHDNAPAAIGC